MSSDAEIRAIEAERILGSALYKEAFEKMRNKYMVLLANPENRAKRDEYCDRLYFLGQHVKELEQVVMTGQIEEQNKRQNILQSLLKRA
jgi:hypothetical protein